MLRVNDAGLDQGQEAKLDSRRVTAGIAYDARLDDGGTVHFRQSVHRLGEKIGAGVVHLVPALEEGRVLEPEVRRQVDDLHPGADQLSRLVHRYTVGGREKDDVTG